MIRPVDFSDAPGICAIYNEYVENSLITFEEKRVTPGEMEKRIAGLKGRFPWLVIEEEDRIRGYAYASPWRVRSAYRYSVESTVYLATECRGRGLGRCLYTALLTELQKKEIHRVIGGIALPNEASVALHESLGFRKCAQFSEVGFKKGQWIDVGYWEKELIQVHHN